MEGTWEALLKHNNLVTTVSEMYLKEAERDSIEPNEILFEDGVLDSSSHSLATKDTSKHTQFPLRFRILFNVKEKINSSQWKVQMSNVGLFMEKLNKYY